MIFKSKLIVIAIVLLFGTVTVKCRSFYKIGSRISGDRLIINDTLQSPTVSIRPSNHSISFRHAVTMVVTCIELFSNRNVYAEFLLNFENVLHGHITAVNVTEFEIVISVYGIDYKHLPENFNSPLTSNMQLKGVLSPISNSVEEFDEFDNDDDYDYNEIGMEIIAIGTRQDGDKLLYTDFRSSDITDQPANHMVIFRYIDDQFLTYAIFETFDRPHARAILSHITDHSMKAEIHAENSTSLDVQCSIFGFDPADKPFDFRPLVETKSDSNFVQQVCNNGRHVVLNNWYLSALCSLMIFLRC